MAQNLDHSEVITAALQSNAAAHNSVAASWRRSQILHNLRPNKQNAPERLSQTELQYAQDGLGAFVDTASSGLDRLYNAVGSDGCCILLADKNGVPVARRGAEVDDDTHNEWGLWTGVIWSEQSEGTNGIGTCIAEERALTIHKDQHFHAKNCALSCTAAPIFGHDGQLIAALDVSTCRSDLTTGFSRLISLAVVDAARQIEIAHFEYSFNNARVLLASPPEEQANSTGVSLVAVDQNDLVIGATRAARRVFGLNDTDLQNPIPLSMLYGKDVDEAHRYSQAGRRTISQALARSGGNVSAAARALGVSRATLHRKIKSFSENN